MAYKRCECPEKVRLRCEHPWWISAAHEQQRVRGSVEKFAKYLVQGHEHLPRTEKEAENWEARLHTWLVLGRPAPVNKTAAAGTVNELLDQWWQRLTPRQRETERYHLEAARKRLGALPISALEEPMTLVNFVKGYLDEGKKVGTPNRIIAGVIRPAIFWALALKTPLLTYDPFGKNKFRLDIKGQGKRTQRCPPDWEAHLLDACAILNDATHKYAGQHMADFIIMSIDLGTRHQELLGLKVGQVDYAAHTMTFSKTKRGEARTVPYNPAGRVAEILNRRRFAGVDAFVIAQRNGKRICRQQRTWVHAVCIAFNIPFLLVKKNSGEPSKETREGYRAKNLHIHDLRHEANTWMGICRVQQEHREFMIGHRSQSMNRLYSHEAAERCRMEMQEKLWPNEHKRAVAENQQAWTGTTGVGAEGRN